MLAAYIEAFGGPETVRIGDMPKPVPGPGDVLIRVAYASINPADYKVREGALAHVAVNSFPSIMGMDCAGRVEAVGPEVTAFAPGDPVIALGVSGMGYQGSYAEYFCTLAHRVFPLPRNLSLAEGATIPIAAACAANAVLKVAPVAPGQQVLVNGGAGSVGSFAIQLLKRLGARVAATCGPRNIDYVTSLGAERVIDYTSQSLSEALTEWAPDGLDVVYDLISNGSLPATMPELIKPGGTLVCIMTLVTGTEAFDHQLAAERKVRIIDDFSTSMTEDMSWYQIAPLAELLRHVSEGTIKPPPYKIMPLDQAVQAQQEVAGGHVRGKILLEVAKL